MCAIGFTITPPLWKTAPFISEPQPYSRYCCFGLAKGPSKDAKKYDREKQTAPYRAGKGNAGEKMIELEQKALRLQMNPILYSTP